MIFSKRFAKFLFYRCRTVNTEGRFVGPEWAERIFMPIKKMECPNCGHKYNLPAREGAAGFLKCPKCHCEKEKE